MEESLQIMVYDFMAFWSLKIPWVPNHHPHQMQWTTLSYFWHLQQISLWPSLLSVVFVVTVFVVVVLARVETVVLVSHLLLLWPYLRIPIQPVIITWENSNWWSINVICKTVVQIVITHGNIHTHDHRVGKFLIKSKAILKTTSIKLSTTWIRVVLWWFFENIKRYIIKTKFRP